MIGHARKIRNDAPPSSARRIVSTYSHVRRWMWVVCVSGGEEKIDEYVLVWAVIIS